MTILQAPTSPWLGDVLLSAASACGAPVGPAAFDFRSSRSVIVIVVDGLGWVPLWDRKGHAPNLRSFLDQTQVIETCLPSTTAAALTAVSTGALPGATRMVGYSVYRGEKQMNLLQFAPDVDASAWQPTETIFERMAGTEVSPVVVTDPKFAGTGLTLAALRGAEFYGQRNLGDRFRVARDIAHRQPSLVYLYWAHIDHAGHRYGVNSSQWTDELEYFDRELGRFLAAVEDNTQVILSADHGMVDVATRLDLAQIPQLSKGVAGIGGEGRALHLHAEAGEAEELRKRWRDYFAGSDTVVVAPEEYAGIFGTGPGLDLLGDAVVFSGEIDGGNSVIVDSRTQSKAAIAQVGVHGSYSAAERQVPLMILA